MSKFEIFEDGQGEFRWRLKAANGEIVATSEGYTSRESAHRSAEKMNEWASVDDPIIDL
jgi:uncharacterized protein YegP (UPF0339 family)